MQLNYYVLGQRIQKIRKNKRISQAVLSTMIDKSAGYISYLECGTKVMSLETFVGMASAISAMRSASSIFIEASADIFTTSIRSSWESMWLFSVRCLRDPMRTDLREDVWR